MIPIWKEIRERARVFAGNWREASRERSETQSFYNDFFEIFGIRRRSVAHYEYLVAKRLGKRGFTDLFWPDVLLVEQKSAGRDLDEAYDQASDYFDGIREEDRPRFLLVSDFQTFELRDLDSGRRVAFGLQELPDHINEFEFILEAAHGQEEWKAEEFTLPRQWEATYPTNLGSVDAMSSRLEAASAEVLNWPKSLPGGGKIERPELIELESRIERSTGSVSVVLGLPGSGKSALVSTLAHRYIERGWPVLAVKADVLDADISDESGFGDHLGLDARPGDFLEQLAETLPVLLILDQVDALAGYIDLRTARLSILLNLVRRLGQTHNVHIVVSSRTFEFQHDTRLKSVYAESVTLELPPWSKVLEILESHGVHAAGWPQDAQELMRSPQALATYLTLHERHASEAFTSYQTMLDRLWKERLLEHERGGCRSLLATEIANRMAEEESLWLATARFDENTSDIDALEAAGILTRLDQKMGFTHQTLFDYALARNFAREPGRLRSYVLKRQESLFLRPKLWAALTYLRDAEPKAYHGEIEAVWSAPNLRRHLRYLLIEFVGQQVEPTDREALLIGQALQLQEERWTAYRALTGSPGWFGRFGSTFVADCMSESDDAANHMTEVLSGVWQSAEDGVLRLLLERWAPETRHDQRSWSVLERAPHWSEKALDLACIIVGRTEMPSFYIDRAIAMIGVAQPEFALRLARAYLDHKLAVSKAEALEIKSRVPPAFESSAEQVGWQLKNDPRRPLNRLIEEDHGWDTLPNLAEKSPILFLEILWPWFEHFLEALKAVTDIQEGRLDYSLSFDANFRFEEENDEDLPPAALLAGLQAAAERFAQTDPGTWLGLAGKLGRLDMAPAQRLIAHSFTIDPKQFAGPALDYLLGDPRRFVLGSIRDEMGTSARLVRAVSDYWNKEEIAAFEDALRGYKPPPPADLTDPEMRRTWTKHVRQIKLAILRALPEKRMTAKARRLREEEMRALPESRLGIRSGRVRSVGSFMDATKIARASDADVINAFRTVPDATGWDHPKYFMRGGNIQLSREFANFAKENPERAIHLISSLAPEFGTRAAGFALEAIAEDNAPPAQVIQLLLDVASRGFDGVEFRSSASRAVERLVSRGIDIVPEIITLLENWLAAPILEETTGEESRSSIDSVANSRTDEDDTEEQDEGRETSLLWAPSHSLVVPGGAFPVLEALVRVRLSRNENDQLDQMLREYLERNRDPKSWEHLLLFLPEIHPTAPDRKAALFEQIFTNVPQLIGSSVAARFLANAHWWSGEFVDGQMDRWRESRSRNARQAYGEIVATVFLVRPDLTWAQARLENILETHDLEDARAGAAISAANFWSNVQKRSMATEILQRLLKNGGKGFGQACSKCSVSSKNWDRMIVRLHC